MCPDTTGAASTDAARSATLAHAALALALGDDADGEEEVEDAEEEGSGAPPRVRERGVLLPGGALVVKLLEGPGGARQELQALCKVRAPHGCASHARKVASTASDASFAHRLLRAAALCTRAVDAAQGDARGEPRNVPRRTRAHKNMIVRSDTQ
jgi:hypothetical protein